jgi:hypothetical protein
LVDVFLGFAQNSFEMQHSATCRFSKEFCENPGNVLTKRNEWIKIKKRIVNALPVFKRVLYIQKLLVLAAKNLLIQNITKGRVKKF